MTKRQFFNLILVLTIINAIAFCVVACPYLYLKTTDFIEESINNLDQE